MDKKYTQRYTKKDHDGRYYIESVNGKLESDKYGHVYGAAIDRFAKLENADVIEVVRCKDCRHFCPYEVEEHKGDCNELVGLESCVYEDDFCSYGEAKMDGGGKDNV